MTSTTTSNIRLTITVTPQVHAAFERLSKASNMSMSKAMGQWLEDTLDAAEFMAEKVEQARSAPKLVMAEMHAYAMALSDETGALMEQLRVKGREARGAGTPAARATRGTLPSSPLGNTGGKGRQTDQKKVRGS